MFTLTLSASPCCSMSVKYATCPRETHLHSHLILHHSISLLTFLYSQFIVLIAEAVGKLSLSLSVSLSLSF